MQDVKRNDLSTGISQAVVRLVNSVPYKALLKAQEVVCFATTCVMTGVLGVVVVCRYVLHEDFFGYDAIVLISAFWMYFIGSSYAMNKREHVRADIVERFLQPKGKRRLRIFSGIAQTALAIQFAVLSVRYLMRAIEIWPTSSAWNIPLVVADEFRDRRRRPHGVLRDDPTVRGRVHPGFRRRREE